MLLRSSSLATAKKVLHQNKDLQIQPVVLFFALIGSYIGQNNPTELLIMIGLGVLATVFRCTGFPLPPLIIGFILGGMMEDNLGRAIRRSGGVRVSLGTADDTGLSDTRTRPACCTFSSRQTEDT